MYSFRHQKDSPGSVPRKIASLLAADSYIDTPLQWASSIVRAWGMSPSVIVRIIGSAPALEHMTLKVLNESGFDADGAGTLESAVAKFGHGAVWRSAQSACLTNVALASVSTSALCPGLLAASIRATAETAHWMAGRHIVDANEAFSLALWSELGLCASMYAFPEEYERIWTTGSRHLVEEETEAFGFDHQTVGSCVARLYKFPRGYVAQCARHEIDILDLGMEEKLVRAAAVAVASIGGWSHPSGHHPKLTVGILAGALLREADGPAVQEYAKERLSTALRSLASAQKNAI